MNQYDIYLKEIFNGEYKCLLGSELKKKLVEKFKCRDDYARKIIQLAIKKKVIKTDKKLTFGRGQYMYMGNEYEIEENEIKEKFKTTRPNIYRVLNRFEKNGRIISYFEIFKLASCTTEKTSSKVTQFEDLIEIVKKITDSIEIEDQGVKYLACKSHGKDIVKYMKEYYIQMKTECLFLPNVLRWLQNNNIIDNENIIYRNKNKPYIGAILNNLVWDAYAYTGAVGFNEKIKTDEKSIVPIEISVTKPFEIEDLKGFYDRLQILRNGVKNNKRKIIPIIFAADIPYEVKREIKNLNIICFDTKAIFGEKILMILENLKMISFQTLYREERVGINDLTTKISDTLGLISETGQEGNLNNLKGDFFEALMYKVLSELYLGSMIKQGHIISYTEDEKRYNYEYDFIIDTKDEKIIFELKGYKKDSEIKLGKYDEEKKRPEKNTIKWFFSHTLNKAKEKLTDSEREIKACYITTAKIEEKAINKIEKMKKLQSKKLDIYYDRKKLNELLKSNGFKREFELIEQYY